MAMPRQPQKPMFGLGMSAGALIAALAIVFVLTVVISPAAQAQTFQEIHTFTGGSDGGTPWTGVTLDRAGNAYGTTRNYGNGYGTVYELKKREGNWMVNPLYNFNFTDGAYSRARVVFSPTDGTLYGTAGGGQDPGECSPYGCGIVFNLRPKPTFCPSVLCPWLETVLYSFPGGNDGYFPGNGDLVFDPAGNMYNMTCCGGSLGNGPYGTAFELTPSGGGWSYSVIYNFGSGSDGRNSNGGVIFDDSGNLYGTTMDGGLSGVGTVFQLVPIMGGWMENLLYSFRNSTDGAYPTADLWFDRSSGNLYGTTSSGGSGGGGTVFELTPGTNGNWTFTLLYSLVGSGGGNCQTPGYGGPGPWGQLTIAQGNLYGTTLCDGANNIGSVFELTPTSMPPWTYTSLHDFTGGADGKYPFSNVTFDAGGNLYGTASAGGSQGVGVVWEITP